MFATQNHNKTETADRPPASAGAPPTAKVSLKQNPLWKSLALGPTAIQRKLAVSQPGDAYEQEADRVAERVMRTANTATSSAPAERSGDGALVSQDEFSLTRNTAATVQRKCAECEEEEEKLHRKTEGNDSPSVNTKSSAHDLLSGAGQPLDPATRAFMEPHFQRSFNDVRVHTDQVADASARSVNALAFTVGRDVAFRAGQYAPQTSAGRKLIAHELAHVAQGGGDNQVRRYRDVKKSERAIRNWGAIDDPKAGLEEKAAPGKGDPVIESIHVKFDGSAADSLNKGELLVTGTLTAKYRAKDKRADIVIPVTGGSSAAIPFGLTDSIKSGATVHKVQGPGYNEKAVTGKPDAQPDPKGEFSHYVKQTSTVGHAAFDFASSMGLAVYFKGAQAIHLGDKTQGSHACIHVDWTANKNQMRLINYHSLIGTTKVTIEYDNNAAFKAVCCKPTRMKRGFVNPCDVFSKKDCSPPAAAPAPAKKPKT
jgi:hypothetical protein